MENAVVVEHASEPQDSQYSMFLMLYGLVAVISCFLAYSLVTVCYHKLKDFYTDLTTDRNTIDEMQHSPVYDSDDSNVDANFPNSFHDTAYRGALNILSDDLASTPSMELSFPSDSLESPTASGTSSPFDGFGTSDSSYELKNQAMTDFLSRLHQSQGSSEYTTAEGTENSSDYSYDSQKDTEESSNNSYESGASELSYALRSSSGYSYASDEGSASPCLSQHVSSSERSELTSTVSESSSNASASEDSVKISSASAFYSKNYRY